MFVKLPLMLMLPVIAIIPSPKWPVLWPSGSEIVKVSWSSYDPPVPITVSVGVPLGSLIPM